MNISNLNKLRKWKRNSNFKKGLSTCIKQGELDLIERDLEQIQKIEHKIKLAKKMIQRRNK